jgi:hypothetical protein
MSDLLAHVRTEEPRWRAEVDYRTNLGINTVVHDILEIEELHDLIERGPNFYAIERIVIYPQGSCASATLTIEEAERQ